MVSNKTVERSQETQKTTITNKKKMLKLLVNCSKFHTYVLSSLISVDKKFVTDRKARSVRLVFNFILFKKNFSFFLPNLYFTKKQAQLAETSSDYFSKSSRFDAPTSQLISLFSIFFHLTITVQGSLTDSCLICKVLTAATTITPNIW